MFNVLVLWFLAAASVAADQELFYPIKKGRQASFDKLVHRKEFVISHSDDGEPTLFPRFLLQITETPASGLTQQGIEEVEEALQDFLLPELSAIYGVTGDPVDSVDATVHSQTTFFS